MTPNRVRAAPLLKVQSRITGHNTGGPDVIDCEFESTKSGFRRLLAALESVMKQSDAPIKIVNVAREQLRLTDGWDPLAGRVPHQHERLIAWGEEPDSLFEQRGPLRYVRERQTERERQRERGREGGRERERERLRSDMAQQRSLHTNIHSNMHSNIHSNRSPG